MTCSSDTIIQKAFRFRIYPSKSQKDFLSKQFGSSRFVYNYFLNNRKTEYLNNKKSLNYYDDSKTLTSLKKEEKYDWLNGINAQTLQASLKNLETAYQRFFKKKSGFPRFHSKKNRQSIKISQRFYIENDLLYIPKLKTGLKINLHRPIYGKQISCFVSKTSTDKYYISICCEVKKEKTTKLSKSIGIDLGIKDLAVFSDGQKIKNPKFLKQLEKVLKYEQRKLSNKKRGSNKKDKQRKILAHVYENISNRRNDFLHKLSSQITNENQIIIMESLKIKNMMRNHNLAKAISDCSWGELIRQIEYKSKWKGRIFHQINTFFPSSKTCNHCKFIVDDLPLNIREWKCPNCNKVNDRDINAAKNILEKGLKDLLGLWSVIPHQKPEEAPSLEGSMIRETFEFI